MTQQKYSTFYSKNFMEYRAFSPRKPPFYNLIVQSTPQQNHQSTWKIIEEKPSRKNTML